MRAGLVDAVAHVAETAGDGGGRLFGYRISRSVEEVRAGAKSRYYPIELSAALEEIRAVPGRCWGSSPAIAARAASRHRW